MKDAECDILLGPEARLVYKRGGGGYVLGYFLIEKNIFPKKGLNWQLSGLVSQKGELCFVLVPSNYRWWTFVASLNLQLS